MVSWWWLRSVLSSLATETEYVRGKLAAYLNDMLSLGADGWRLDAAKRKAFSVVLNVC